MLRRMLITKAGPPPHPPPPHHHHHHHHHHHPHHHRPHDPHSPHHPPHPHPPPPPPPRSPHHPHYPHHPHHASSVYFSQLSFTPLHSSRVAVRILLAGIAVGTHRSPGALVVNRYWHVFDDLLIYFLFLCQMVEEPFMICLDCSSKVAGKSPDHFFLPVWSSMLGKP